MNFELNSCIFVHNKFIQMKRFIFIVLFIFSFTNFLASQERFVGDGLFEIFANYAQKRIWKIQFEIESINAFNRNQKRIVNTSALKLDSIINYDEDNIATSKKVFLYNNLGQTTKSIWYRSSSNDSLGISAFAIQHFQYDTNGYCTNIRVELVNKPSRRIINTIDFKYNNNGLLASRIIKSKRDTTGWENNSKITVSYTDSKKIFQTTNFSWKDSTWAPENRLKYYYDSLGNTISKVYMVMMEDNEWIKRYSSNKSYNSQNKITSSYHINFLNDSLPKGDTGSVTYYYYDNNGTLIKDETSDTWGDKHHYFYDASGNLIKKDTYVKSQETNEWKIFTRNEYSYDEFNNKIESLFFYIKDENGTDVKELSDKIQFVVDSNQNSDSTIVFPFLFFGPKGSPYLMKKKFYSRKQDEERNNPRIKRFYYSKFINRE